MLSERQSKARSTMSEYSTATEQVASVDQMIQLLVMARHLQLETLSSSPSGAKCESYRASILSKARDMTAVVVQLGSTNMLGKCDISESTSELRLANSQWWHTACCSLDDYSWRASYPPEQTTIPPRSKRQPRSYMLHQWSCVTSCQSSPSLWEPQRYWTKLSASAEWQHPTPPPDNRPQQQADMRGIDLWFTTAARVPPQSKTSQRTHERSPHSTQPHAAPAPRQTLCKRPTCHRSTWHSA